MNSTRSWYRSVAVQFLVALAFLIPAIPVDAQVQRNPGTGFGDGRLLGVGYTGVIPDAAAGAGVLFFPSESRLGFFAEGKTTWGTLRDEPSFLDDPGTFGPGISRLRKEDEWNVFNGGVVLALNPDFAVLIGGGLAQRTRFVEFVDVAEEFSFLVEDPQKSGNRPNGVVGFVLRVGSQVALRFGMESDPRMVSLGGYFLIP
ncbi:MAG: hypothetical protein EA422_05440 [Gemmatimonadales bacterium]|nr:MAG: hypothetical protein EA422_05440 [Gemmatimonadales bacterium]